jgi:hypothetical protein
VILYQCYVCDHGLQLAAVWVVGLQSDPSSPPVPESIKIGFGCFPDIKNPGSYTAPDRSLLQENYPPSNTARFSLPQWWEIGEGVTMGEPFNVRDLIVDVLLGVVQWVCNLC